MIILHSLHISVGGMVEADFINLRGELIPQTLRSINDGSLIIVEGVLDEEIFMRSSIYQRDFEDTFLVVSTDLGPLEFSSSAFYS